MFDRVRGELKDSIELFLIPALAIFLPWKLSFKIFTVLCRFDFLYREVASHASTEIQRFGFLDEDLENWIHKRKLVTVVDHADYYLSKTRSDRWMNKYLEVSGSWYGAGEAAVLATFHWGAGMWGLRYAAKEGLQVNALVAPLDKSFFRGRGVLRAYARARTKEVSRVTGQPTLDVTSSLRPAISALRAKQQVLGVIDVPSDQVSASIETSLLGHTVRVPKGLLRLVVDRQIPFEVHLLGMDMKNGHRWLKIERFEKYNDVDQLAKDVFKILEEAIIHESAAWHFWGESGRFFGSVQEVAPSLTKQPSNHTN